MTAVITGVTSGKPSFVPTAEQIAAAQTLFTAMAFEQTIRPIVQAYQTAILAKYRFLIARKWVQKGSADRVILDPQLAYLLEEPDASTYYAECHAARDLAGLKASAADNCPLCEAEWLRIQAEHSLLHALSKTRGLESLANSHFRTDQRQQAIDLSLRLLAPFVGDSKEIMPLYA